MLHGGIIAGLLDLIMANAAGSHIDPEKMRFAVTLSLSMNFIGSASDGPLELRAETTGVVKGLVFVMAASRIWMATLLLLGRGPSS